MVAFVETEGSEAASSGGLIRSLDWKGAFWVAAGVPPLVLFSIGGIAGTTGKLAFVVWIISMVMGFLQSFTYAEIAGMFANKSGGASVYGATAWLRYSKFIAPLSVWCNWFAWSPVLSLGCAIAAGYILNALFPIPGADSQLVVSWIAAHAGSITADSPRVAEWLATNTGKTQADAITALMSADGIAAYTPWIRSWSLVTFNIPFLAKASLNATFVIGGILMLIIFAIQHRGILGTASVQKWLAIIVLLPLLIIGLYPIFSGQIDTLNVTGLLPPTAAYSGVDGTWSNGGWTLFLGGLYIAAWSTYGFETAVCYTRELKNPKTDTFKAIFYSGLLCCLFFSSFHSPSRPYLARPACWHRGLSMERASARRLRACAWRQDRHAVTGYPDDHGALPGHHDSNGRLLAHALSRLEGRLAAEVSRSRQRARGTDTRHVDGFCLQPVPAGDRL